MRRILSLIIIYVGVLLADTSLAIVKINPTIGGGDSSSQKSQVCSNYSTKADMSGLSQYSKCIKEYEFHRGIDRYFNDNLTSFQSSSDKVKLKTKNSSDTNHYDLSCHLFLVTDEINQKTRRVFFSDIKQKGIYYLQLDCELRNSMTNEIIYVYERKRKVFVDNGLLNSNKLIEEGKLLLKKTFPKAHDLEQSIKNDINYHHANLRYKYDNENKKLANGVEKGQLIVSNIIKQIDLMYPKANNLTEFTLQAKQGKFIDNNSKKIIFTPYDYYNKNKKLEYQYQTYDCNQKDIVDKKFETFTLKRTSQLSIDENLLLKEIKVPFECPKPYYTATVIKKTISKVKPLEQYRGITKVLTSFEEDKSVYYIYIDVDNAKIEQYHIDKLSSRTIHKEVYELNMKSCQYEHKSKDKVVKNLGGHNIFKSEDAGWGFDDSSKIYVDLPSSDEQLSFSWGSLHKYGTYHASKSYKKKIPKVVKDLMKQVNGMATLYRNETKNSKEIDYFKNLYDYPATPKDVQCGGKVAMESLLIPPLDGLQDLDVKFSIDIRPSTKSEKKVMKAFLNNKVGNPGDFIIKAIQGNY
jgi:hypothetical protein